MTQIILTAEQTEAILQSPGPVLVVDARGVKLGTLPTQQSAWTAEEWAELIAKADADLPCVSSEHVLARLRELEASQ